LAKVPFEDLLDRPGTDKRGDGTAGFYAGQKVFKAPRYSWVRHSRSLFYRCLAALQFLPHWGDFVVCAFDVSQRPHQLTPPTSIQRPRLSPLPPPKPKTLTPPTSNAQDSHIQFIANAVEIVMPTKDSEKRANLPATAEASPPLKRAKPEQPAARGRKGAKKGQEAKVKAEELDDEKPGSEEATKASPAKRKREKRAKPSADSAMPPLPPMARTLNARVLVGAHCSAAGGSFPHRWLAARTNRSV
jgi:hypothetical protein